MVDILIWAVLVIMGLIIGYQIGYDSGFSDGMKREFDDWEE